MPLTAVADYVEGLEDIKAFNNLGNATVLQPTAWTGKPQVLGLEDPWLEVDDAAKVENARLLYADDYAKLVSSGMSGLGATLPVGQQPQPFSWNGWTLVILDGAYMYRNKLNKFVTPSQLQAMMSGKMETRFGQKIPAGPSEAPALPFGKQITDWNQQDWLIGGAIVLGTGYLLLHAIRDIKKGAHAVKRKVGSVYHGIRQGLIA